jgi:nicotinate-nucleotide adenylyltransferase
VSASGSKNHRTRIPGHVERVGLFGGTFDPIHLGHLILAQTALEELDLDRLIFIPAAISPYKKHLPPSVPAADRLEMIRLAIAGEPRFSVDERELHREGASYTIDTVRSLMGDYPGVRFLYLIGADNVPDLPGWHESGELKNLIDFAVFERSRDEFCKTNEFPVVRRRIDISSTEIRERLAKGLSVRYLLPSPVHDHIMTHRLYSYASNDQVQA